MKPVKMRKAIGFVEYFFPTGLFACASRPPIDAALDLMTTCTACQNSGQSSKIRSHHSECKGNSCQWNRCEVFLKDNADVILVLEPGEVDNFLDYEMSKWPG